MCDTFMRTQQTGTVVRKKETKAAACDDNAQQHISLA